MLYMEALFQNQKKHMLQIGIPRVFKYQATSDSRKSL